MVPCFCASACTASHKFLICNFFLIGMLYFEATISPSPPLLACCLSLLCTTEGYVEQALNLRVLSVAACEIPESINRWPVHFKWGSWSEIFPKQTVIITHAASVACGIAVFSLIHVKILNAIRPQKALYYTSCVDRANRL